MENEELIKLVTEKANKWLTPAYDAETQAEVKRMLEMKIRLILSNASIRIWNSVQVVSVVSWVLVATV